MEGGALGEEGRQKEDVPDDGHDSPDGRVLIQHFKALAPTRDSNYQRSRTG